MPASGWQCALPLTRNLRFASVPTSPRAERGEVGVTGNRVAQSARFCENRDMKPDAQNIIRLAAPSNMAARVDTIDWMQAGRDLDAQGCTLLKGLLSPHECRAVAALYPNDNHFRSRIVMSRHGVAYRGQAATPWRGQPVERSHGDRHPLSRKPR